MTDQPRTQKWETDVAYHLLWAVHIAHQHLEPAEATRMLRAVLNSTLRGWQR